MTGSAHEQTPTGPSVLFAPGPGTVIVGPSGLALVGSDADAAATRALAAPLLNGAEATEVMNALRSVELVAVPPMACLFFEREHLRVVVRGTASVVVTDEAGAEAAFTGNGLSTWQEVICNDSAVAMATLSDATVESPSFPLLGGVAPAVAINVRFDSPGVEPEVVDRLDRAPHGDLPLVSEIDDPLAAVRPAVAAPIESVGSPPVRSLADSHAHDTASATEPPVAAQLPTAPDPDFDFGHLLIATRHLNVEEAAVREDAAGPPDPTPGSGAHASIDEPAPHLVDATGSTATTRLFEPPEPEKSTTSEAPGSLVGRPAGPPPSPTPGHVPPPQTSGMILGVPGMQRPASPAGAPPPIGGPRTAPPTLPLGSVPGAPSVDRGATDSGSSGDSGGDGANDSPTVSRATLNARAAEATPAPSGPLDEVQAVHCPDGHPNPSHADLCRTCGQAVTDRAVTNIKRPTLGRIRFSDGREFVVNGPMVLGRKPPPDTVLDGEVATPITLASVDNAISRVHLVIQVSGWQVQVTDRDSVNHTFIELPGREPFQLRPAEPYPIPLGTRVDLGEAVQFTFEAAEP